MCGFRGKCTFLIKDERRYEFPTLVLVLCLSSLPLDEAGNTMLVSWAHGTFIDSLILRSNKGSL